MERVFRVVLLAGLVAGLPRSGRAAEPADERVIDIEVDAADLPESRAGLEDAVEAELGRMLADVEELPAGVVLGDDRRVYVEIQPSPIPGTDDLLIHVEVQFGGEVLGESKTETCLSCTEEGVADRALMLSEPLLSLLPAPEPAEPPAPVMVDTSDEVPASDPTRARLDPVLISGAALLGGGLVAVGVGVGLIAVDERIVSPTGAAELGVIKYRQPGIAVAVIGGAAAVSGSVLLKIALGRRQRAGAVAAVPTLGPRAWGLSLTGRF